MTSQDAEKPKPKGGSIVVRPARLHEYKILGRIAAITYFPTDFTEYLSPHRLRYYGHYERGFQKRALSLMLQPRMRSMVAVEASKPDLPIAYIHFERLGDDEAAKRYTSEKESLRLRVYRWLAWAWFLLLATLLGAPHEDPVHIRKFIRVGMEENKKHWESHEDRRNRFHVRSFVVLPQFQGRGVGKKLMTEVTSRAEKENVVIGLEASPEGEYLVSQTIASFLVSKPCLVAMLQTMNINDELLATGSYQLTHHCLYS
jgi:ribosomal protein S18 acetylase RimI-like enzyme